MIRLRSTPEFDHWFSRLRDSKARQLILTRFERLMDGNAGDHKAVGEGLWELRIHHGPGYRVYYTQRQREWILLLAGGDKDSQKRDIRLALTLAKKGE